MNNMSLDEYLGTPDKKQQAQPKPAQYSQADAQGLDSLLGAPSDQMQQQQAMPQQQAQAQQAQAPQKGFWAQVFDPSTLANNRFFNKINTYGGNVAEGLTKGTQNVINTPSDVTNYLTNSNIAPKADFSGMQAPFVDRNNMTAKSVGELASFLPSLIPAVGAAKLAGGIPMLAKLAQTSPRLAALANTAMQGGVSGFTGSGEDRGLNALLGMALPVGAAGAGKVLGTGLNVGKNILNAIKNPGKLLGKESENFLEGLSSGRPLPSQEGNPNLGLQAAAMGDEFDPRMLSNPQATPIATAVANASGQAQPKSLLGTILKTGNESKLPGGRVPDFDELNKTNNQNVANMYKEQIKPVTKAKYKNFEDIAEEAGFDPNVRATYDAQGVPTVEGKHFQFENHGDWQPINDVLTSKNTTFNNAVGKDAQEALRSLKMNPSPQNAQKTISQLGKSYRKLEFKVENNEASNSQIKAYETLKELQSNIEAGLQHTLESNGAANAHTALKDANRWFANNDLPYKKAPGIKALFNDEVSNPANILRSLKEDNIYTDKIKQHITKNKSLQDSLLKQHLSKGVAIRESLDGGAKMYSKSGPFSAIEKNYTDMPNYLQDLLHPTTKNELEGLLKKRSQLRGLGAVIGALPIGYEGIKKFL